MVATGFTVAVPAAPAPAIPPAGVVNPASVYHFQVAPVPKVPPVWLRVTFAPEQDEDGDAFTLDATVETALVVTVTFCVLEHGPNVAVIVYAVVDVGAAYTVVIF